MGTIGRTRWMVGWSLHSHARSRSFLCASCNCCEANGRLDADVEERQLPPTRGRPGHCATYLAIRLFSRYLRSREIMNKNGITWEQNALRAGLIKEGEEWLYRGSIFDLIW